MGPKFKFELEAQVKLKLSGEKGYVIGRAESTECVNQYHTRYVTGDGRQTESWIAEDALEAAE